VQPLETEFGRKRRIDQSACNKDDSCVDGFCPSFVTIEGARPKARAARRTPPPCPDPIPPSVDARPYAILVSGVGGTGVVTIGAVIAMAAYLEGRGAATIDMAGLAQKGGAVFSHVKIAARPDDIHAVRIGAGEADLVLGGDLVVAGAKSALATMRAGATAVVTDCGELFPGDFTRRPDFDLPAERIKASIRACCGDGAHFIEASAAATALFGAATSANMMLLGYAYQAGLLPVGAAALKRAIALNGEATATNLAAFDWGRALVADPSALAAFLRPAPAERDDGLAALAERCAAFLTDYQDRAYAERYRVRVAAAAKAERERAPGTDAFARTVARGLFKLMAYKDEYEVARLYSDGAFAAELKDAFDGDLKLTFYLAPSWLARGDGRGGEPKKIVCGSWMMQALRVLARLRRLRGTRFDPFGSLAERRAERALIADYEALIAELCAGLTPDNRDLAVALAALPETIRGYGAIKMKAIATADEERRRLLDLWRAPPQRRQAAE
jgi:indolepyruvate ferredoxin oxidoreductase